MNYQERIKAIKANAKYHPELSDRDLSIMLDAAFSREEENEDNEEE